MELVVVFNQQNGRAGNPRRSIGRALHPGVHGTIGTWYDCREDVVAVGNDVWLDATSSVGPQLEKASSGYGRCELHGRARCRRLVRGGADPNVFHRPNDQ